MKLDYFREQSVLVTQYCYRGLTEFFPGSFATVYGKRKSSADTEKPAPSLLELL